MRSLHENDFTMDNYEDYEAVNRFGNTRKATSMSKQIGRDRIIDMGVYSHLINVRYS